MKKIDIVLLIVTVLLTLFGLLMLYDASSFISFRDFGTKYHYVKNQALWMVLGFVGMAFFARFNYKKLYNLALPILVIAIGMLLAVFIPGIGAAELGAHRWINLRFSLLQPAEFIKLALAIYLAAWFSTKEKGRFSAFLLLIGAVLGLVMLEPDMGTTITILLEALLLYFLSGGNVLYFVGLAPVLGILGVILAVVSPYRMKRIETFLHPESSVQGASYHVRQILIALGSGGVTGVGLGNSLQKYAYLPENATDSIFAIIAEEVGFVGAFALICAFTLFIWRGMTIAMHAKDTFGKLLASGIVAFLAMQIIINLGAMTVLLPLTGIPLPFISYGGSALVVDLWSVGILLNISMQSHV